MRTRISHSDRIPAVAMACGIITTMVFASTVDAQVVQLPSIETFSYSGSVLVPDGGTTSLGSVGRSADFRSRSNRGVFRNSASSHRGVSASVQLIDLDEMDRRIRGLDSAPSIQRRLGTGVASSRPAMQTDPKAIVRLARHYYAKGDYGRSKLKYQDAIEKLDGDLKEYAIAEYRSRFLRR